jgi:hypothetical protein
VSGPVKSDVEARAVQRRMRANTEHCVVCRDAAKLFDQGYILFPLAPSSEGATSSPPTFAGGEQPRQITSQFAGHCKHCMGPVARGALCWFTPGQKGVECVVCHG